MAATDILIYNGTPVTPSLTVGVAAGAAAQTAPISFGTPRAASWLTRLSLQMGSVNPVAGEIIDVYMAYASASGGPWPAGIAAAAGAWAGLVSAAKDISKLEWIGSLVLSDITTVAQIADIGVMTPKMDFGCAVLYNRCTAATIIAATVAAMTFTPIKDQSQ